MPARTKSLNSKGSNKNMHGAEQEQNEMHIKHRKSNEKLEDKLDTDTSIQDSKPVPNYKQLPITNFVKTIVKVKDKNHAIKKGKSTRKLVMNSCQCETIHHGNGKLSKMIKEIGEELKKQSKRRLNWENQFLNHHSEMISMCSEISSIICCTICYETPSSSSGMLNLMHCPHNHPVCADCLNRMTEGQKKCPICREKIIGRANSLEKIAVVLGRR